MSDDNGPAGCPDAPAVKASGVETSSRGGRLQPGLSHLNKTGGAAADELSRRCALLHQRRIGHIRIRIDQQMLLRDRLVLEPELARQARTLHRHEEARGHLHEAHTTLLALQQLEQLQEPRETTG